MSNFRKAKTSGDNQDDVMTLLFPINTVCSRFYDFLSFMLICESTGNANMLYTSSQIYILMPLQKSLYYFALSHQFNHFLSLEH
jgi:hypothetical protein